MQALRPTQNIGSEFQPKQIRHPGLTSMFLSPDQALIRQILLVEGDCVGLAALYSLNSTGLESWR